MTSIAIKPSRAYLNICKTESVTLQTARKTNLLILDLNGTLVSRTKGNKSMYVRPYSKEFLDYIFDNFTVMLWSSAQTHSVKFMSRIFGERRKDLLLQWDRHSFDLNKRDFNRKVVTLKNLEKVWKVFKDGRYDATNTILLDDSSLKTALQPYNAIHPTEFVHNVEPFISSGESELLHVMEYLKRLQFQSNIANYIKNTPYQSEGLPKDKHNHIVLFYAFHDDEEKQGKTVDLGTSVDNLILDLEKVKI